MKNDEDPFKNESTRVLTTFLPLQVYGDFFRRSRAANSVDPGPILFKLLWLPLLPARMMKIHSKMRAPECSQHFFHYKSMEIFSDFQGQLTP